MRSKVRFLSLGWLCRCWRSLYPSFYLCPPSPPPCKCASCPPRSGPDTVAWISLRSPGCPYSILQMKGVGRAHASETATLFQVGWCKGVTGLKHPTPEARRRHRQNIYLSAVPLYATWFLLFYFNHNFHQHKIIKVTFSPKVSSWPRSVWSYTL